MIEKQIIIATNNTSNDILIKDLGINVLPSESRQLTGLNGLCILSDVLSSKDLYDLVDSEDIIINNGTSDLNRVMALDYITIEVVSYVQGTTDTIQVISLTSTNSQNINTNTPIKFVCDTTLISDGVNYSVSGNTDIKVLSSGLYEISYNISCAFTNYNSIAKVYININDTIYSISTSYCGFGSGGQGNNSNNNSFLINLNNKDIVTMLFEKAGDNSQIVIIPDESHITIKKLRNI